MWFVECFHRYSRRRSRARLDRLSSWSRSLRRTVEADGLYPLWQLSYSRRRSITAFLRSFYVADDIWRFA